MLLVSSKTTRATPFRYWLPRICLTGSAPTGSGVLRQAYTVLSRSITSRLGLSISSARYCGSRDVLTWTVTESGCEVTVTSLRTVGVVCASDDTGASSAQVRPTATSTMGIRRRIFI